MRLAWATRQFILSSAQNPCNSNHLSLKSARRGPFCIGESLILARSLQNQPTENIEQASLHINDCGLANYVEILQLQHRLCRQRQRHEIPNTALIVEHPAVITLGARQSLNKLRLGREDLATKQIELVETRRGGGATAHNPGQLVCYPIVSLQEVGLGIGQYIRTLEAIGSELLGTLGLGSTRQKGAPGLWVGEKKIASIGVRVSKFVTYHGIAINIQNDLSIFDFIVPCGLDNVKMTSLQRETGRDCSMNLAKRNLSILLRQHFHADRQ